MDTPRIDLCMIVRDEQPLLGACLAAAAPIVDRMIVVDTGSIDGTVDIALDAGATVLHHVWDDDFAAARNVALDAADGDWVLVLDADERLDPADVHALRRRLAAADAGEAFTVSMHDELDDGGSRSYELVRLFRNRPRHRYSGTIHEQITPSIARGLGADVVVPRDSGLHVRHVGYRAEHVARQGKAERNRSMLRRAVERDPADPSTRWFLVRELIPLHTGRAVPGDHLAEAFVHCGWLAAGIDALPERLRSEFVARYGSALLAAGRPEEARALVATLGDGSPAIELLRADLAVALDADDPPRLDEALDLVQRVVARSTTAPDSAALVHEPAMSGALALERAASLCLALGRHDEARALVRRAVELPGGGAAPWRALAAIELAAGERGATLAALGNAVRTDPHDPWAWCELGETLRALGLDGEARSALDNAAALAPGWERPRAAGGPPLVVAGDPAANPSVRSTASGG